MSDALEDFIYGLGTPSRGETVADGAVFLTGLRKFAAEEDEEAVDARMATPEDLAPYAEAGEEAMAQMPGLDEMAAMPPDPITLMTNAAAQAMKCQFNCLYYSEMVRGPERESIVRMLDQMSWRLCDDAKHLIRKVGVLTNGQGAPMPPVPTPEPTSDPKAVVQAMMGCVQQYMVTLQALHDAVAGDPMEHTVQHMIIQTQKETDKLERLMPADTASGTKKEAGSTLDQAVKLAVSKIAAAPKPSPDAVVVPPPGAEPMAQTALRDLSLALQQSESEKAFLANRAQQAESAALENAVSAENAQAEAQLTAETAEAASQQAQDATLQAQEAMTAATQAEENAAAQAEAKMRLSMRIQQFRQQLADIVSQDPVQEEALDFGEVAAAGSPMTANQQEAEMQAAEEAAMVEEQAAASGGSKAKKEVNQAQRAQNEADQQAAQAASAMA